MMVNRRLDETVPSLDHQHPSKSQRRDIVHPPSAGVLDATDLSWLRLGFPFFSPVVINSHFLDDDWGVKIGFAIDQVKELRTLCVQ